jgi:hypothetical protein
LEPVAVAVHQSAAAVVVAKLFIKATSQFQALRQSPLVLAVLAELEVMMTLKTTEKLAAQVQLLMDL